MHTTTSTKPERPSRRPVAAHVVESFTDAATTAPEACAVLTDEDLRLYELVWPN